MSTPPDQTSLKSNHTTTSNASALTMFRTTFTNTVTTPVPADLPISLLIALLHDHSYLITMQPIVTRHSINARDPTTGRITYDVWEAIDLLPFGWWKHEIQFTAAFTDKKEGVTSYVEAPMGFVSTAQYTVKPGEQWDGEGGGWVLEEKIESSCSVLLKWFVQGTMVPVRQKMHRQIMEKCREREQRRSQASFADGGAPDGNWV